MIGDKKWMIDLGPAAAGGAAWDGLATAEVFPVEVVKELPHNNIVVRDLRSPPKDPSPWGLYFDSEQEAQAFAYRGRIAPKATWLEAVARCQCDGVHRGTMNSAVGQNAPHAATLRPLGRDVAEMSTLISAAKDQRSSYNAAMRRREAEAEIIRVAKAMHREASEKAHGADANFTAILHAAIAIHGQAAVDAAWSATDLPAWLHSRLGDGLLKDT